MKNLMIAVMTISVLFSTGTSALAKQERQPSTSHDKLAEAESLLRNNKTEQAYTLLDGMSEELTGIVEFDYLYGVAALRTGKPGYAIFALERAVAQNPQSGVYLLDLGRAYFDAHDLPQAMSTFSRVLELNPPDTISLIVNKYINSIDKQLNPSRINISANIQYTGGNDTNVNNATASNIIELHNVYFLLNDKSVQQSSPLQTLSLDTNFSYSPSKRLSLFGLANASQTVYPDAHFVDTNRVNLGTGIKYLSKSIQSQNFVSVQRTDVDQRVNSYIAYAVSDQQWNVNSRWGIALYGHGGMSRLPNYPIQNSKFATGGGRVSYRLPRALASISGFASWNLPESNKSPYASLSAGIQTSARIQIDKRSLFYIDGLAKYSDYYRGFIGLSHSDALGRISMGYKITPAQKWTLSPEFSFTKTRSNVELFEYDKLKVTVSIQRQLI
jgi:hypothetical protein